MVPRALHAALGTMEMRQTQRLLVQLGTFCYREGARCFLKKCNKTLDELLPMIVIIGLMIFPFISPSIFKFFFNEHVTIV